MRSVVIHDDEADAVPNGQSTSRDPSTLAASSKTGVPPVRGVSSMPVVLGSILLVPLTASSLQ
jgi:hypothetical protein